MDYLKIIAAALSITAGSIGIWLDVTKPENKKWGIVLLLVVVLGGMTAVIWPIDHQAPSVQMAVKEKPIIHESSNHSAQLKESQALIKQYEALLFSFNQRISQIDSVDHELRENLNISRNVTASSANVMKSVERWYQRDSMIQQSSDDVFSAQKQNFMNTIQKMDSVTGLVQQVSSNLLLLENQLILPIDHIDFYVRLNHQVDEKVFKYHKLRNHFSPASLHSEKGNFRIEQKLNESRVSHDFLKIEHAFLNIKDAGGQNNLISEEDVFGSVQFDDIYLFSNEELDSLVARIDYQARITPKLNNNTQLFVRSLTNGNGRIKVWIDEEERAKHPYDFESAYLMIHSGNKEIGLSIKSLTHTVAKEEGKTYDFLDFKLGEEIFDHAIRSPR